MASSMFHGIVLRIYVPNTRSGNYLPVLEESYKEIMYYD